MTVLDNVIVGYNRSAEHGLLGTIVRSPRSGENRTRCDSAGSRCSKSSAWRATTLLARNLPYGDQRRLEIARVATGPKILLLDEPAAAHEPQRRRN